MSPGHRPPAPREPRAARRNRRAAAWLLPVLLLHAVLLYGAWRALRMPAPDEPAPVIYTRVLLPRTPPPRTAPPATARAPRPAATPRSGPTLLAQQRRPAAPHAARQARRHAASSASPASPAPPASPASPRSAATPSASAPAGASTQRLARHAAPSAPHAASEAASEAASQAGSEAAPAPATAPDSAASAAAASPSDWPPSTRLDFALRGYYRGDLHGNGELEWRRDGPHYFVRLAGSALIDFSYTSTGRIDGGWLAPTRYVEQVLWHAKTIDFDRATGQLHFSARAGDMPITAHLQDSASVFMQLAHELQAHPRRFAPGAELRLRLARPTGTTTWTWRIAGRESIATGVGPLDCWHLVYDPPADAELGAEVWLAPALQDLPVQIRLRHGADDYLLFTLRRALQ